MSRLKKLAEQGVSKLPRKEPVPKQAAKPAPAPAPESPNLKDLIAQRDRLLEKFTVMQADLGGAFYEMAIRDHLRIDVLTRKAAELQRVDAELTDLERQLEVERSDAAGHCPACGSPFGHGVRFCNQCGNPLSATVAAAPKAAPPAPTGSPEALAPAPAFPAAAEAPTEVQSLPEPPKTEAGP